MCPGSGLQFKVLPEDVKNCKIITSTEDNCDFAFNFFHNFIWRIGLNIYTQLIFCHNKTTK